MDLINTQQPTALVTLDKLEYRIATHMQGAYREMLQVGQCLNEAKDSGLVAHGLWEEWVGRNTGMGVRQAQKLMQAARNVPAGSLMEQLPISKIQAILSLPEPQREDMAAQAIDHDLTYKQLQAEIKALQERAKKAEENSLQADIRAQAAADEELERREIIQREAAHKQAQEEYDEIYRVKLRENERQIYELELKIDGMEQELGTAAFVSPDIAADAELERLRQELSGLEAYAEQQAELRQKAQQELLNQQSQEARGGHDDAHSGELTTGELLSAVRSFIGLAGVLPHMGMTLLRMSDGERRDIAQHINMIATWVDGSRQALDMMAMDADA